MHHRTRPHGLRVWLKNALATLVAGVLALGIVAAADGTAVAAEQEYRRGPAPTLNSLRAAQGPFSYARVTVPEQPGFGGGTIYYPTNAGGGTFGAVAMSPGLNADQGSLAWYGPKLATNGFVVFTINNLNTATDSPPARGRQLLAALDYLTGRSAVANRVDPARLAVAGHSLGGGGAINAAAERPGLQAAIPLTPYVFDRSWPEVRVPTFILGAENDNSAPVAQHAEPLYQGLVNAPERAYLELAGRGHLAPNFQNATIGQFTLAWLKRYVDNDTRYERFLCPPPAPSDVIAEYRDTCPGA
ncbi:alpha/beta hydrolase [Streptomyces sp. DSM 44917]|uniref:Alpha/beta hydrolase n=1 Tax=Streptomyces boetiae TaxID=3075541 RepID=A0ABU2LGB3_9ACTN|nr:alpha/beta hydrolase [Streptomyces sp. DSM 44917]MDT0310587.1 alpha/beta hydrolase [Streptomyces sp. DSM 44917]